MHGQDPVRPWGEDPGVEPVQADVMDPDALRQAVSGCRAIIIWCIFPPDPSANRLKKRPESDRGGQFSRRGQGDLLEWLGVEPPDLKILRAGVPATVLRAPMILGSGCASFEILRYLVDRLAGDDRAGWLNTACQPIAIRNVLHYLTACWKSNRPRDRP